ncbi:MAG: aminotransferase class I/II-fold pyridoxal phosphate-dependent enzyme, partial [Kiloniellales bacterium]|nr:aminotransferase class I/II-fold pyridoxal phosphate-dependent enzyme [Kiloniellales bacterium]
MRASAKCVPRARRPPLSYSGLVSFWTSNDPGGVLFEEIEQQGFKGRGEMERPGGETGFFARRMDLVREAHAPLSQFFEESGYLERFGDPDCLFLAMGDPHDVPPEGYVEAIREQLEPRSGNWFAYKTSTRPAREAVAASLRDWRDLPFEPEDIAITPGAFGALAAAMTALIDPGDEIIINLPPWFNYDSMALARGGVPVKVPVKEDFDLDLEAISAAITE